MVLGYTLIASPVWNSAHLSTLQRTISATMEKCNVEHVANGMQVAICNVSFPSHTAWANGYANATCKAIVSVYSMSADRWKWRMQCGAAEFVSRQNIIVASDRGCSSRRSEPSTPCNDCDVVVVDSMLDAALLAAELRRTERAPKIVVYMHENQLTTPFVHNDRDVQRGSTVPVF